MRVYQFRHTRARTSQRRYRTCGRPRSSSGAHRTRDSFGWGAQPALSALLASSRRFRAAIVQGTRTPPSHGGNPGSNPGSGTAYAPCLRGVSRYRGWLGPGFGPVTNSEGRTFVRDRPGSLRWDLSLRRWPAAPTDGCCPRAPIPTPGAWRRRNDDSQRTCATTRRRAEPCPVTSRPFAASSPESASGADCFPRPGRWPRRPSRTVTPARCSDRPDSPGRPAMDEAPPRSRSWCEDRAPQLNRPSERVPARWLRWSMTWPLLSRVAMCVMLNASPRGRGV